MDAKGTISRRGFLKSAVAVGAALSVGPALEKVDAATRQIEGNSASEGNERMSSSLPHRTLGTGKAAFEVSALGFGVMGMTYNRSQHPDKKQCIRLLREAGAELVWVVPFTPEFARLEPRQFLDRLLGCPEVEVSGICVGRHWRFGRNGTGDSAFLEHYAVERGIRFRGCPELELAGETVSSSAIRRAVAAGKLDRAAEMLGRPYRLIGTVERGYHAASDRLDCPTANLAFTAGVLPPDGVYAAAAWRDGVPYAAAVNIGFAPTFGWENSVRRVEVHLLGFSGNLYGCELGVEFLSYLREERTFPDPEALKQQIDQDMAQIRHYFEQHSSNPKR